MKIRSFGWGIVCVVAFSLLAFSGQDKPVQADRLLAQGEIIPGGLADKIVVSPGIDKKWHGLLTLAEQVAKDTDALKADFNPARVDSMAKLLGARHAVISGKNYELLYGKDSAAFWSSVYSEGATLDIKVVQVYVSNAPGPHPALPFPKETIVKPPIGSKLFNAVAFVTVEFHIIKKTKQGAVLKNNTYSGELGYIHIVDCQWVY